MRGVAEQRQHRCMTIRPFRFGLVAGSSQLASLVALARRAESLGFHTLLMPDPLDGHDPLAVLASVAAATERLYVGTYVLVDAFRDKRMLCWQASTLHELSGGRFELGLGAGRPQAAEHAHDLGVTFPSATDRVERLAETVEHLKASERRPPLLLAARGAKMRALAARTADIVTMAWQPRTGVEQARSLVDDVRARAGGRLDDLELAANILASVRPVCRGWRNWQVSACPSWPARVRSPSCQGRRARVPTCCAAGGNRSASPTTR